MEIGPNIADVAGNLMNQDGDGTNGEAIQDRYTATRAFNPYATQTFPAPSLNLPIYDLQSTRASIFINQDIATSDVNVKFSLTHTYDSDLIIRLIGPGGQTSPLVRHSESSLLAPALDLADRYQRSVYDSLYLAIADRLNGQMLTPDQRLVNDLRGDATRDAGAPSDGLTSLTELLSCSPSTAFRRRACG